MRPMHESRTRLPPFLSPAEASEPMSDYTDAAALLRQVLTLDDDVQIVYALRAIANGSPEMQLVMVAALSGIVRDLLDVLPLADQLSIVADASDVIAGHHD